MANSNFKVRHGLDIGDSVTITDAGVATGITNLTGLSNANITLTPGTTGDVILSADTVQVGDSNANATITTNGTGDLILNTNAGTLSGSITIADGVNGDITMDPYGTGNIVVTLANGGNLTNSRNYVFGAIRNLTTAGIGDIWALNASTTTNPFRGLNIDNSDDTTKGPGLVLRSYGTGQGLRGRFVFEKSRGTAAVPAALQTGDVIGSIDATGYSSTGFINDTVTVVPAFFGFTATENWVSNTALGTTFILSQAPSATTITTAANLVTTVTINPQTAAFRSDAYTFSQGKTGSTQNMALDVNGNLTVTGDIRVNGGDIQNPGGTSAIALTSANATTTIKGDAITLENNAGTDYAVLNSTSATFTQPIGFPVKTAAQWNAITGAAGQQVSVSDSASGPHPNGMMAFWDTSNARWSYIHDNTAV